MSKRKKSGSGSGLIAGLFVAVIAFLYFTSSTTHAIVSSLATTDIGGGLKPTDVINIPISTNSGFSGLDLNSGVGLGQ